MKFSFFEVASFPVAVIDDFYENTAYEKIWQELTFLNNDIGKLLPPEKTWSAAEKHNDEILYLKKNKSIGLDSIYNDRSISNILTENRKIFKKEVTEVLEEHHLFFRYINDSVVDATLVNYYEDKNYYLPHKDSSVVTVVTFFYKNPKSFSGGDLILENKLKIECLNNRSIFFPSVLYHEVDEIKMKKLIEGQNLGRFSTTQLLGIYA